MSDPSNLTKRIDAEFAAVAQRLTKERADLQKQTEEREKRVVVFNRVCDELRDLTQPRLEALTERFGARVKVSPRVTPGCREAVFEFQSKRFHVQLKFTASADMDFRNITVAYHLQIVPVLTRFDGHQEIQFPLEGVDRNKLGAWLDDRIVDFVRTYIALDESDLFGEADMVEDPVTHLRFPKLAASSSLDWQGRTHYFMSDETRCAFTKEHGIKSA
jgi:YHS domain-containing protein